MIFLNQECDRMVEDKPKKYVIIFFNNFKYEGCLMWEDDIVYCINDIKEGRLKRDCL